MGKRKYSLGMMKSELMPCEGLSANTLPRNANSRMSQATMNPTRLIAHTENELLQMLLERKQHSTAT